MELDSLERERQRDPPPQVLAFPPLGLESLGLESLGHQTDLLPPERRGLPEQRVVRPGPGLRHQMGQRPEQLRVRQTDQPLEKWPRARQEFVFRCRLELRVLAAARCGASRPRFHALIHSGVAWPLVDFERGRRAPLRDTSQEPDASCLGCAPSCGRHYRSPSCHWLRAPSLFQNRHWLRVRGRASNRSTRGNSMPADRRCHP